MASKGWVQPGNLLVLLVLVPFEAWILSSGFILIWAMGKSRSLKPGFCPVPTKSPSYSWLQNLNQLEYLLIGRRVGAVHDDVGKRENLALMFHSVSFPTPVQLLSGMLLNMTLVLF